MRRQSARNNYERYLQESERCVQEDLIHNVSPGEQSFYFLATLLSSIIVILVKISLDSKAVVGPWHNPLRHK